MIGKFALVRMSCCFFAGCALSGAKVLAPPVLTPWATPLSIFAVLALAACAIYPHAAIAMPAEFACLVFALSFGKGPVNWLIATRPVMFLGAISFPLYLVHVMPLLWLQYELGQLPARDPAIGTMIAVAFVLFCIALATILHHVVERPCHRLGRAWAARRPPQSAEVPSATITAG